jgi:uncharacterized protein
LGRINYCLLGQIQWILEHFILENLKSNFKFSWVFTYLCNMIERQTTAQVLADVEQFPVVALLGPRQAGKTTLAKSLQNRLPKPSLYLDLELSTDLDKLRNAESFLSQHVDKCVILDEVQRMPALFPLLRALVDRQRTPGRFILLGSASPALVRDSSDSLAGRIAFSELAPFSWLEVEGIVKWQEHWFRGGFPDALLVQKNSASIRWLDNFVTTFVERDLRALGYNSITPIVFQRLLMMLASLHGNLLNASDLSRSLGVSQPTVAHYLDILEGAYLIHRLPAWFTNIGKRLVKAPKIYIRDSGILHRVSRIPSFDDLQGHIMVGASWEGYVIEELRRTNPACDLFFYRTHGGAEADLFAILPNGKKLLIEVKYADVPSLSKGFYQCITDLQPDASYVLTPGEGHYERESGLWVYGLRDFLKSVWSKTSEQD